MSESLPERKCLYCGSPYAPIQAHQKYCSARCKGMANPVNAGRGLSSNTSGAVSELLAAAD